MPTNTNSSRVKVERWLRENSRRLETAGIGTARLDCLVLLEDVTSKDRAWLLAHPEFELNEASLSNLITLIKKRSEHVPLAYVRGKTEFYGREFIINSTVLEPRPESEAMIDILKGLRLPGSPIIVDIGTGSGALAITVKLELPNTEVTGTDIDKKCLAVAHKNTKKHGVKIDLLNGNLLEPLTTPADVLLANLPYVPDSFTLNDAAMQEPKLAIFGGKDGLDIYRNLFDQIASFPQPPKYILTESLPFQHVGLAKIAASAGYKNIQTDDFIQLFTVSARE